MAKDVIFRNAPPPPSKLVSQTTRVAPRVGLVRGGLKQYIPVIDLTQYIKLYPIDILREGDEWFNSYEDMWDITCQEGKPVGLHGVYRRRLHGNKYG